MNGMDELAMKIGRAVLGLAGGAALIGTGIAAAKIATGIASSPLTGNAIAATNAMQLHDQNQGIKRIDRNTVAVPAIAMSSQSSARSLEAMQIDLHAIARKNGAALLVNPTMPRGFGIPAVQASDFDSDAGANLRRQLMTGKMDHDKPIVRR